MRVLACGRVRRRKARYGQSDDRKANAKFYPCTERWRTKATSRKSSNASYAPMGRRLARSSPEEIAVSKRCGTGGGAAECGHGRAQEIEIRSARFARSPDGRALKGSTCWPPSSYPAGPQAEWARRTALVPVQGRPFLEHLLEVTSHRELACERVVLGAHCGAHPAKAVNLKADEIVINHEWEKGKLSSIQAALSKSAAGNRRNLLCLIDHPLISKRAGAGFDRTVLYDQETHRPTRL